MLLVIPIATRREDLDTLLSSLRTSVGIARGLGASLLLPCWREDNDRWIGCQEVVDTANLSKVVPLSTEADAASQFSNSVVQVISTAYVDASALGKCLAALNLPPLPAGAESTRISLEKPMRTRAEVIAAFRPCKHNRVVLLVDIPGSVLSASASVFGGTTRDTLDRIIATPPAELCEAAHLAVRRSVESTSTPGAQRAAHVGCVLLVDEATDAPSVLKSAAVLLSAQRQVIEGPNQTRSKSQTVRTSADVAARAVAVAADTSPAAILAAIKLAAASSTGSSEHAGEVSTATATSASASADESSVDMPSSVTSLCALIVDLAMLRGGPGTGCEAATNGDAPAYGAKTIGSSAVACRIAEAGILHGLPTHILSPSLGATNGVMSPLASAAMCRWLCASASLALLPAIDSDSMVFQLVTSRQALGRPVDHAYVPQRATSLPDEVHAAAPPDTPRAQLLEPPAMQAASCAGSCGLRAASTGSDRLGAREDTLAYYEEFLTRTAPTLQRLPFHPPMLSARQTDGVGNLVDASESGSLSGGSDYGGTARRVAIIVEPRASQAIVQRTAYVIRNVGTLLNAGCNPAATCTDLSRTTSEGTDGFQHGCGWSIQFFHGSTNRDLVAACFTASEWERVKCVSLGVDNLASTQEYSQLLTSHWFWSQVGAEHVLIFQEDALLCAAAPQQLHAFSERFSYVGAPWEPWDGWVRGKAWLCSVGGNGGLSLRRRSHAIACLDLAARQPGQWEDAYFVERLQQLGHLVAPAAEARHFAVERSYGYEAAPCGLHKAYNYLPVAELSTILAGLEVYYDELLA